MLVRAAWENNIDIADPEALSAALTSAGFNGPHLVSKAQQDDRCKQLLRENCDRAVKLGLCGVPSYVLGVENPGDEQVFWGQDRLDFVLDALLGWRVEDGDERTRGLSKL
jgi:2-hydroxychromene-2-carboxylate isomerase